MNGSSTPAILLVIPKWADFDPNRGPSNARHNLLDSLTASGVAEARSFFVDEYLLQNPPPYDDALIRLCETERPDAILIALARGVGHHACADTLAYLRGKLGIKTAGLFPDTFAASDARRTEGYADALDLVILQDSYTAILGAVPDSSKYLPAWTPQDPAYFFDDEGERDLDVSFLGSVARYPDRKLGLGVLADAGIHVLHRGGHAEGPLGLAEYGNILRRSRISLNFARPVFDEDGWQCKGRVFETTLSGALLVEQANPETRRWFEPGVHYVEFADERELVEKTRHYLADEDARAALARAGRDHAREHYSADAYWRLVLGRLGLARA